MVLYPVTGTEVAEVIRLLPSKRTTDINGMSTWLLKECHEHLIEPLTTLVNVSFERGVFPKALTKAKVIPTFKRGDPLEPSNYRPISILPVFSKIFEKLFLNRLLAFLEKHNILSDNQFGFRQGRSTVDAINSLVNRVVESLDEHHPTLSVFLDLSKAFDCVDHGVLLHKLDAYGVRGVPLNWLASYLTDRTQQVEVSNQLSQSVTLRYGVPQGSILGPVLFLIYVNNLTAAVSSGKLVQFADDTTLCCTSESAHSLEINTFIELNSCIQYFTKNNLKTNFQKTNFIYFSRRPTPCGPRLSVMVDEAVLEEVESTKFLGIYLDRGLAWDCHLDNLCTKVSCGIFALRTLSKYCSPHVLRMAYFGIIQSHLTYGIILWGGCAEVDFLRLFRLQKKAVRIIAKLQFRASCKNAFREMDVLPLACIYILDTVFFCKFKCSLIQGRDVHAYETRGRNIYRTAQNRSRAAENMPSQAGVRLLNKLPESIRKENDPKPFKRRLKHYLLSHAFYSVREFMDQNTQPGSSVSGGTG